MKSKAEFDSFYANDLKNSIEQLEARRKAIAEKNSFKNYKRNLKWAAIACVVLVISSASLPDLIPMQVVFCIPVTILYAAIAPIVILVKRNKAFAPIKHEYKQTVIPKIISFIDPGFTYKPFEGISKEEFNTSDLFERPSTYKSEDLVFGNLDGFEIKMSDINCSRTSSNRSSNSSSSQVTVFMGLYVISKLRKNFPSRVTLKPSLLFHHAIEGLARKFLGDQLTDTIGKKLELNELNTGNAEFDKYYSIRCEAPDVAKALLTPDFTQLILSFLKEVALPVHFSFFDNEVHIAINGVNLFEADAFTSFTEKDISRQYFNYLNLCIGVTEAVQAKG